MTLVWFVARASGWVAWAALMATTVWGALVVTKLVYRPGLPRWLLATHRHTGWVSAVLVAVHVISLYADSYVQFALADFVVPGRSPWRPNAVAWGVIAFDLLVVVTVTSAAHHRMPRRTWRAIHLLVYPVAVTATVHGVQAGTDAHRPIVRLLTIVGVSVVSFGVLGRVLALNGHSRRTLHLNASQTDPGGSLSRRAHRLSDG